MIINEATKNELVAKSRNTGDYKDKRFGKNRFERRNRSKISNTTKEYNKINMNQLFKNDQLEVIIPVIGETDNYTVTLRFDGVIKELSKALKNNKNIFEYKLIIQAITRVFNTTNVYIKCSCPDFKFTFAHWDIVNNISVDDSAQDPGPGKGIRNPNDDKGKGCKHTLLVLENTDWIMKVSNVIFNYIKYAERKLSDAFLKLIFPKIYGILADEMVEQDLIDTDKYLKNSAGLIDAINKYNKTK